MLPPERGHSCPQQRAARNAVSKFETRCRSEVSADRNVRAPASPVSSVCSWCAKKSPVVLMNCKVFIMVKGQKPCSQLCGRREQFRWSKPETANARAVVYRELDSASLNLNGSGQPFRRGEASTDSEALTKCKGRTPRGERRQRAQTETPGTWEARHRRCAARQQQPKGRRHNPPRCGAVASDRPIVAAKSRLQSGWSQGALVKDMLSQKPLELIG